MLLFIGALASIAWSVYFSIVAIFLPYQIEFREGAMLVLTKILLNGGNPFTFKNQPLGMKNRKWLLSRLCCSTCLCGSDRH
jgi:hypothetical protein